MMERHPGPGALMIHAQALERLGRPKEALDTLAWYLQRQPDDRSILTAAAALPPVMSSIIPWRSRTISASTAWTATPRCGGCW